MRIQQSYLVIWLTMQLLIKLKKSQEVHHRIVQGQLKMKLKTIQWNSVNKTVKTLQWNRNNTEKQYSEMQKNNTVKYRKNSKVKYRTTEIQ